MHMFTDRFHLPVVGRQKFVSIILREIPGAVFAIVFLLYPFRRASELDVIIGWVCAGLCVISSSIGMFVIEKWQREVCAIDVYSIILPLLPTLCVVNHAIAMPHFAASTTYTCISQHHSSQC